MKILLLLFLLLGGNNMLLASVGSLTGTLKQLGEQQLAFANANQSMQDGEMVKGDMPFDQLVSAWTNLGGAGGAQGLQQEIDKQGHSAGLTAQDLGFDWSKLMPNLAKYYEANPNQMPDVTPNTQNLRDIITNNTVAQYMDASGKLTVPQATLDQALTTEFKKYGVWNDMGSIGSAFKSFLTEGALPGAVKLGVGMYGAMSGLGNLAGMAGFGGDAYLPGLLNSGGGMPPIDPTWGVNPRDTFDPYAAQGSWEAVGGDPGLGTPGGINASPGAITPIGNGGFPSLNLTQPPAPVSTGTPTMNPGNAAPNTPAAASSALQRILKNDGSATAADYLSIAGSLGAGALGIAGSDAARSANNDLADKYLAYGAPSRARYEASMTPGFDANSIPGFKSAMDYGAKSSMNALSTQGNPIGSPNAWNQTLSDVTSKIGLPAIQNYQAQNANAGGISSFTPASIGATNAASTATTNMFNSAGSAINDIFNPRPSLAQTLAQYKSMLAA